MMKRDYIVPDCLGFYLLSLYPIADEAHADTHMAKIQYVVNMTLGKKMFTNERVKSVERYMSSHPNTSVDELFTI